MLDLNLQKMKKNETVDISPIILDLRKKGPVEFRVGLSWDFKPGMDSDLDVTAILLHEDGKMHDNAEFIFYNNLAYPHQECDPDQTKKLADTAVYHSPDERTGAADGDDEYIDLRLDMIPDTYKKIAIAISSYSEGDPVIFGRIKNASVRLYTMEGDAVKDTVASFDLSEDMSTMTSMLFVELTRDASGWKFKAVGSAIGSSPNGLSDVVAQCS